MSAHAQNASNPNWIEYYSTGGGQPIVWDAHELDTSSLKRVGEFIQYRVRLRFADGKVTEPDQMQVNCRLRTRGQLPDPRMRDTYNGTLGREEAKAACLFAARIGLLSD